MPEAPGNVVRVAKALARLGLPDAVFVGGATIPLFLTDAGAVPPRVTFDVDVVVDLRNRGEFYRLEEGLREAGYSQPVGGPICRWTIDDVVVCRWSARFSTHVRLLLTSLQPGLAMWMSSVGRFSPSMWMLTR